MEAERNVEEGIYPEGRSGDRCRCFSNSLRRISTSSGLLRESKDLERIGYERCDMI